MSRIKRWVSIVALCLSILPSQTGAIATAINILDPTASTEIRWNDGDPVIILHNSIAASGRSIRGRTFGHVIALSCDPYCNYVEKHELAHVKQANILGDWFIPVHVTCMTFSYVFTGSTDRWNPLEWGPYHNEPVPWGESED